MIHHYSSKKISYSLRTKSARIGTNRALIAASQLDDYWLKLRMQDERVPKQHLALADTGMRLAEAAGLEISDIHIDDDIPFVRIQPHPWRRLKTVGSERDVPLAGSSLWAAQRIVQNTDEGVIAFSRYNRTATTDV